MYVFSRGQFIQAVRSLDHGLTEREKMRKFWGKGSPGPSPTSTSNLFPYGMKARASGCPVRVSEAVTTTGGMPGRVPSQMKPLRLLNP